MANRDSFELASLVSSVSGTDSSENERVNSSRARSFSSRESLESFSIRSPSVSSRISLSLPLALSRPSSPTLLPIAGTIAPTADLSALVAPPLEKQKRLGVFDGLALVVGLQIGSGIFSSPSSVDSRAGAPIVALAVWLVAGLLAWTGAASYAELGTMLPVDGGPQYYLDLVYGPLPAFLFSWVAVTVLKPGSAAIIALVSGQYLGRFIGIDSTLFAKAAGIVILFLISGLNCFSPTISMRAGSVFLIVKLLALAAIGFIGVIVAIAGHGSGNLANGEWLKRPEGSRPISIGDLALALYAGLWAFDGWDNLNYVAAEMKHAEKDLPRVIHLAMPIVIISYLATNLAYFVVLPREELTSSAVAISLGQYVGGAIGSAVFALIVMISCVGALNATLFAAARLVYAAAQERFLPLFLGSLSTYSQAPVNALVFQALIAAVYILIGEFETLVTFYGIAGYVFYFLIVLGLILLRFRQPLLPRPYRTFILTPVVFCCVALFLISRGIFSAPLEALSVFLFVALGVPVYYFNRSRLNDRS
ncbi:amino acid permease-domain-containing protein [Lipomyces oligophaga]|uniref:amino acid permease-domain-containing protein n=1 Tax=Lipomyces oligophaga TaxID=45792 RepID=UPI0034CED563